jgi:copper chaperone CopZ
MNAKQQFHVTGMTCGTCETKVKSALLSIPEVIVAEVSAGNESVVITAQKPLPVNVVKEAIAKAGSRYQVRAVNERNSYSQIGQWFSAYKPVLLIFAYLIALTVTFEILDESFDMQRWMRNFMGGFFIAFSFFKLLNLSSFSNAYATYDLVAGKFKSWGYIYPFIELSLGFAYLINLNLVLVNSVTFVVMSVSLAGVIKSVAGGKRIQCACLGTVFNLPMSSITIIEDGLMVLMSLVMLAGVS